MQLKTSPKSVQRTTYGDSRGKEQSPVQQSAVVVVVDEVVDGRGVVARLGSEGDVDLHLITGVMEVDDVDVEDQGC